MFITKYPNYLYLISAILWMIFFSSDVNAQDGPVNPSVIIQGRYHGLTPPLRKLPVISESEREAMVLKAKQKLMNPGLRTRSYPFSETALPKGQDPVWQKRMGANGPAGRAPITNFSGQSSPYYPPDANGTVGPNHYMQTINTVYAIYDKAGNLVSGPTNMNLLFSGVTGSNCNDGDPLVLYDEEADRWLAVEFSLCGSNDYMLIAVSTTNDPTGTWHKYSFDVADVPDYEKFGIWQDGYYMGTNNSSGNDIYVFERTQMLAGQQAQAVGFNNPWRPTTIDGFMCVPPLDNDGDFAPAGDPGLFVTISDDAIAGGSDQLWIYELDVNWTTPSSSTFNRIQQLNVAAFDSNFGNNWTNIKQPGTSQELDAIPQVIMNPPQYRNFGSYETIVCCHTVDVDNTDHAGIRWYELRRVADGDWTIRQQGTYAPDEHSRWMGSIMLNGHNEIGLGYSISSTTVYPGIRYCGQSSIAYYNASGIMDVSEEIVQTGAYSQTLTERWGDYAALQVDPLNDSTFWFTSQYIGSGGSRLTKIAAFNIPAAPGYWIGSTSSDWTVPANWLDGNVPGNNIDITISANATNWPVYNGNLILGTSCNNMVVDSGSQLTVNGNVTISSGHSLTFNGDGEIILTGNWNADGDFYPGTGTITFSGATGSTVNSTKTAVADYMRETFTNGMTALSGPNTSTATGDDASQVIPLNFTFTYAGIDYTNARICTNGWLSLDQSGASSVNNVDLFTSVTPNTTLAPWWDDLEDDNTSKLNYLTTGAAPNRVFTAEWYRVKSYYTGTQVRISFQVKLYETTNVIEFHYGNLETGNNNDLESASIGIEDETGGVGHFIEATQGSTTVGVIGLQALVDWPAVNYRFTPPDPVAGFTNININKTSAAVEFNVNTVVSDNFQVSPGASFSVKNGNTLTVQGTNVE